MTVDAFATDTPEHEFERDGYKRPRIIVGDKKVSYTRCTTFVGCLEDTWNLSKWSQRNVARGIALRDDLRLAVASHTPDEKSELDRLCADAREAVADKAAATMGTALHRFTEKHDRGQSIEDLPAEYRADLAAYAAATADMRSVLIEQPCVQDLLKIGGTPDRVIVWKGADLDLEFGTGRTAKLERNKRYIADVKTGKDLVFGVGKMAMQLSVYARSRPYDVTTGERGDHGADALVGLIIHLPVGKGECTVYAIDLFTGWEGVKIAKRVRDWRAGDKGDKLLAGLVDQFDPGVVERDEIAHAKVEPETAPAEKSLGETLLDTIAGIRDVESLGALWRDHRDVWTPELTAAAAARKKELAS
jgi:hypothetical protein